MIFEKGDTLLFVGDSITDCGRERPVGELEGLGTGYVSLVDAVLGSRFPEKSIKILNTGISGNRVTDLEARWDRDVLALKPDWVSIMIGINDVWRQFDRPGMEQVDPVLFENTLRKLVAETSKRVKGVIFMSPYFLEPDRKDPMRSRMDEYGAMVKKVARETSACFVDTQKAFDQFFAKGPSRGLCEDRVHPNLVGHQILADAFLAETLSKYV